MLQRASLVQHERIMNSQSKSRYLNNMKDNTRLFELCKNGFFTFL